MLCGVCLTEEDVVEPAVPDGRRQSLPGNGTGFLDMNDESYQRAMDLREKEHGIREIDAATNLHRSEARALAMAIIERAEHVSKGAIDGLAKTGDACCKLERRYSRMGDSQRASAVRHSHGMLNTLIPMMDMEA